MKRLLSILLPLSLVLLPWKAGAQIDAIIDAVVDAVEPTPVYDTGLREATENLASKIDRLNHVLFGGEEETSGAYRYMTMYSELYDLTTAFSGFVDRCYHNASRLESVYSSLEGASPGQYARAVQTTWYTYDNTVRAASRVVAKFKKVFGDPSVTNAEVREAAREAIAEIEAQAAEEDRRMNEEIAAAETAAGLVQCASALAPSAEAYVAEGRALYGTTISDGDGGGQTGPLGTAVMLVVGLLCLLYGAFAGFHLMKGTQDAEVLITRLLVVLIASIVTIIAVQRFL